MIIRGDEKNRAHWKTGILHPLLPGHDSITKESNCEMVNHIWNVLYMYIFILFFLFDTFLKLVCPNLQTNKYQQNPGELENINKNI